MVQHQIRSLSSRFFFFIFHCHPCHYITTRQEDLFGGQEVTTSHYGTNFSFRKRCLGLLARNPFAKVPVLFPSCEIGVILILSELKRNNLQHLQRNFKSALSEQASNMSDSTWNSNLMFTIIRAIIIASVLYKQTKSNCETILFQHSNAQAIHE